MTFATSFFGGVTRSKRSTFDVWKRSVLRSSGTDFSRRLVYVPLPSTSACSPRFVSADSREIESQIASIFLT